MNKIFKSFSIIALSMAATSAMAQTTESAYFNEGHVYRHELNPAFGAEKGYVSMPALGNFHIGLSGNIAMDKFLFPGRGKDGQMATFMHPNISYDEFMSGIHDSNDLNQELKMQILSFGFKGMGGYNTFGITLRENMSIGLPKGLFDIAKGGLTNKDYSISGINAHAQAFAEIAIGHSHKINDHLRIGAKLKALVGAANVDINIDNAHVNLAADGRYVAELSGRVEANVLGLSLKPKSATDNTIDEVEFDNPGVGGYGFAADLGVEYKLNDQFSFSGAVLDLGFINWKSNHVAVAQGAHTIDMGSFTYDVDKEEYTDGTQELEDAFDDFTDAFSFETQGNKGSVTKGLNATLNFGAEYRPQFYDKLSFGLMNTTRLGDNSWTNFRLSANVAPAKFFSAGVNVSAGTYGFGFGWIIDLHPSGFGIFVAMDRTMTKLIPFNSNLDLSMGINFPF